MMSSISRGLDSLIPTTLLIQLNPRVRQLKTPSWTIFSLEENQTNTVKITPAAPSDKNILAAATEGIKTHW